MENKIFTWQHAMLNYIARKGGEREGTYQYTDKAENPKN